MKISLNWLNDYVDIKKENPKELADKITKVGVAVETIDHICNVEGLIVGYVESAEKIEGSDKLNVCNVNLGEETVQIVCGAPNVKAGQKVIVSPVGTTLPNGMKIKEATLKGIKSVGMICALEEIGVPKEYLSEEELSGIHVLKEEAKVGEDALKYLDYDDTVYGLDLNPNRNDCLSMLGFAYEAATITKQEVTKPVTSFKEEIEEAKDKIKIKVNTENCPYYSARVIKDATIKESPDFIKARLINAGMRPINNVVDISNYVMLEYGQPLHFFDADKIKGNIEVRMAKKDEKTITLDKQERILNEEDIVITNGNEITAIAGVMGGANSDIDENTKNIVIESAIFDPLKIRYTSIKLDLRSEASIRFEKGLNKNYTDEALERAADLLVKYADAKVLKGTVSHDNLKINPVEIEITEEKINKVLGITIDSKQIEDIFNDLGFEVSKEKNTFKVIVPPRRMDIAIKEDLIEEVGRIYGYHNIEGKLPTGNLIPAKMSDDYKLRKEIKNHLQALGFFETRTFSLVETSKSKMFTHNNLEPIKVLKPMNKEKEAVRQSIIPSLIEVLDYNLNRNQKDIQIYEISSTFGYNEDYLEEWKVAGLIHGEYINNVLTNNKIKADFYLAKGVIESLLDQIGLKGRYSFVNQSIPEEFHPGQSAAIKVGQEIIGYLGKVHPNIYKDTYVFELSLSKLGEQKVRGIKYKEPSKFPAVTRDVALIIDKKIPSEELTEVIKKVGGKLLKEINIFDLYQGENIDTTKKQIAYNLIFESSDHTLTEEEINIIMENIIKKVQIDLNGSLRS